MKTKNAGNQAKYLSYKLAHDRMKLAVESGFPLEAIAIAESIMTDRLLSHVNYNGAGFDPIKTTLTKAAQKAVKICRNAGDQVGQELAANVAEWANGRNAALHEIAKSGQGIGPRITADDFVQRSTDVAVIGMGLVSKIKNWHQKMLRKTNKAIT